MEELQKLAQFIEHFRLETVDSNVLEAAKLCILDTIGLSLGAADNKMFQDIKEVYLAYEKQTDDDQISIWGINETTTLRNAIFLNGILSHTLELDDVHTTSKTHIGAVVIPAAWGLAEKLQKSGRELIEAVICGYEVMSRIGMGFGVSSHRNKGWHVTGTAGTFGSAAACAKLLGFNSEQIMAAFGLAGTQSSATWAFISDGATNKVLHTARAAASGFESCLLVLGGMRGSGHILDAPDGGLFPMMSDAYDYSLISRDLGIVYEILQVDKKPYPCCRSTHCAIDAALKLCRNHPVNYREIEEVRVSTYLVGVKQCALTDSCKEPKLPTEAKFSTPYTVARALIHGNVGLADFFPDAIADPQSQALAKKVIVSEDPALTRQYPDHWGCRMEILMSDGTHYTAEIPDASGSVYAPLTPAQVLDKVTSCCHRYDKNWITSVLQHMLALEQYDSLTSLSPVV